MNTITCRYCGTQGRRGHVVADGWILAKNRPFEYACKACAPLDKVKDSRKDKPEAGKP